MASAANPPPVPPPGPGPGAPPEEWTLPPIFYALAREYIRILIFSISATMTYILISPFIIFPSFPTLPFPSLLFLGLLCIMTCFVLGDGEPDGYFHSPPNNWEKGVRVTMVKILEVTAEYGAYRVFVAFEIRELFFGASLSFNQNFFTAAGVYFIAVMCIAGLRTFLIFPWIILSLKWSYKLPLCWLPDKPK